MEHFGDCQLCGGIIKDENDGLCVLPFGNCCSACVARIKGEAN